MAAPVGAERALELKTRPYNEGERAQAESAIASLNAGLERSNADRIASKVGAPDEPAQVLQSAPTGDMVRARQVARLFGLPVTFIEPHARFNGVHIEGQIFISPQEKHPVLAVMGHEVLHGVMSKLGGEQAQALRDRIAPFLRPEAVQARLQAEPHRGREHATEEAIADLNGSMWMDPKFWQAVREQDPHAFRQLAYRFMELAATVHQKLGKVSRFQAEKFTTDVDTVRRILAEQHAMLAKEEGVERLSPNEKAEFGVRKEKPAEPAKFDRTEGEEPAVERRRVARNAPEPREMPADHEVEMAPRVDAALRRWAKGQGDDRDLAAAIQRDGQRVPGARMLENTQGTVADETPSFDRDKDTTPFYSALARGVEAIPSKAQGADGWRAQVKGLVNKGLVKQDEIEWTGLDDWLKLQPGKVSKEQVLEYLKANGVKVEEVQKGGEEGTSRFDQVVVDASALGYTFDGQGVDTTLVDRSGKVWQYDNLLDAFIPHGPEAESDNPPKLTGRIAELADEYVKISDDDPYADRPEAQTRYSQYTLPGGENYREVLLTLPTDSRGADESMIDRLNQRLVAKGMDGLAEDQRAALQRGGNDAMNMLDDLNQRVGIRTEDVARAMANGDPDKQYRSSHWDEPNILAHIRLNDRNSTDPLTEQQQADIGKRAQMQKRADELAHKIGKASRDGRIAGDIRREELLKELRPLVRAGKMTPAEMMRRLGDRVRQAIYEADDGVTVLASKALSTEGRYGDPERSLDLEVVAREGYDPTTLWRQMLHEAQAAKQDSTFLSRVLREGEAVDPLVHRPGVEIYLREGASGEQLQSMLDELAKHGAQYLTVVVDGRRSGQSMGGEMPPAVGVRIQYVPEFEQRYGMENLLPMQDVSLAAKMQAKAADLAELADLVSGKVEGVSHAHQYWYETQVAFGHQYRELLNGIATGSSEGIAGAAAGGGNWRGQSVREGLASADRQSGKAALEQPARADDAVGRDATRTAPVAEPSFSREENEQRRGAGLPTREVQVNGKWRPIEDSTGRIIGQGDFLKQQAFYKWFKDSPFADATGRPLLVHRTAAVDAALSGKPTRLEGAPDGLRSDAELLANLLEGSAFRAHGLSDLDAPTQRVVLATVRDLSHDAEILGSVVRLLPVRVVDLLAREKLAPEDLLRNDAMLRKFLSVDDDRPIAARVDVANTLVRAVADVATERARSLSGVAPTGAEVGSALGTNVGYLAIGGDGHTLEFKSAVNGGESSTNPDIRFARATAVPAGLPAAAPSSRWERSKAVVSDLIDEGLARSGVYRLTAPMSEGTARAKAVAQNFANAERRARDEWNSVASYIEKNFDQAQREKMWNAADEENDILAGREPRTASNGLAALDTKQRALVNRLHIYGEELLQRARDVGMFNGEGVPYWTPRMMVMLDQAGEFQRPQDTTPGKKTTSGGEGRNVFTSSSNLKQRKYLSSSETAAAMQAKGGELVRDIYTMPMAMARLERAIAGRELINQIKELGKATGQPLVLSTRHEGFFTLDHGSFTTWQPRFEKDPATGKMKALLDENGEMVFDRVPLYISKEFEGPVRSILTQQDGPLYRAFMLLKSKAMSAIMFSPLIHNMVIFGRALGYDPTFAGTAALYVKGYAAKQDRDLVRSAIDHGMVPMGQNKNGMMDITDVARGFGREGGPLDPNESLVAHGAGALAGLISKKLGAKVKGGIDAAGDFWHGTLLWNRIGDLQMGIYQHAHDRLVGQGFSEDVAGTMAAHWANRYAGAVGRENMSAIARKTANVLLFSRSFNMGNVGTIKDMFYGMPEGLRGKILHEATPDQAKQAFTEARRKAVGAFVADTALALIGLAVAQSAVDKLKKDKSWEEIFGGYTERAGRMWEEVKRHPATPTSYNPLRLSPTFDNEPGKQERVDYGEIPGQGARHQYMRLPTGKVVEDLFNWMLHPAETFSSKMSPLAKAVWQVIQNDKGFDVPVVDPDSSAGKAVLQAAAHLAKAQVPWDTIVTMWDKLHGKTTPIENDKLVGQMTGFTWSQGHPGGPEAGVYAQTEERVKQQRLYAMEEVKRLLRYDQEDKARERLEEIGLTPKEVSSIIKRLEKPKEGMGREQRRKFGQHSTEEDQRRMDSVTR